MVTGYWVDFCRSRRAETGQKQASGKNFTSFSLPRLIRSAIFERRIFVCHGAVKEMTRKYRNQRQSVYNYKAIASWPCVARQSPSNSTLE
jgi:hypothetical protein